MTPPSAVTSANANRFSPGLAGMWASNDPKRETGFAPDLRASIEFGVAVGRLFAPLPVQAAPAKARPSVARKWRRDIADPGITSAYRVGFERKRAGLQARPPPFARRP